MCSRFSVSLPQQFWGCLKNNAFMQQTINLNVQQAQERISLSERIQRVKNSVKIYLDTKSTTFSKLAEFDVSRRQVLRLHIATIAVIICAAAIAQYPLLAIAAAICAARVVYHINKEGKA
jgi:hypothetical protein